MMTAGRFPESLDIRPLKFDLAGVPHATIETNRTCNMRCRFCYNLEREAVKPLDLVRAEIDLALSKRNASTITLLGGEPTLHPDLPEIVAHVKKRGRICQILTNGLVFLEEGGEKLLDRLKAAGVDRICLHVDEGQTHVHSDIDAVRRRLFAALERRKIPYALSLTVEESGLGEIPGLVRRHAAGRGFEGVLAVLARDPLPPQRQNAEIEKEYESFRRELEIEPVAYVPSNLSDADVQWLIYAYFINAATGRAAALPPRFFRAFSRGHRLLKGRYPFTLSIPARLAGLCACLVGWIQAIRQPSTALSWLRLFRRSRLGREIRFHFAAVQTPPVYNAASGYCQLCFHCPDAAIRNGKLTPVCLADRINPLPGAERREETDLAVTVYAHLGESAPDRRSIVPAGRKRIGLKSTGRAGIRPPRRAFPIRP